MKFPRWYKAQTQLGAWMIWLMAAIFYAYELFQRVMPSVITQALMQNFQINATTLGSIISLYFYAYAFAQLVAGILIDRIGGRVCLSASCMLVAISTFFFAQSQSVYILALARIGVGVGSAFAFVGCLKLASVWFPKKRFALLVGLTNTLGILGGLFSEVPLTKIIQLLGWQESLVLSSILGLMISVLIVLVIQDHPSHHFFPFHIIEPKKPAVRLWEGLKKVFHCKQTWLIAIFAGIMVAPIIAFAELWAVPFFELSQHLSPYLAAQANSFIFIGIAVGAPLNGLISGALERRKVIMFFGNIGALITLSFVFWRSSLWSPFALHSLLFLSGYCASTMLLCFSLSTQYHSQKMSGTVIAFTNMMIMVIGAIFQPLIGKFLDIFLNLHQATSYTATEYRSALSCLLVILFINLVILFFIQEKPDKHLADKPLLSPTP